ncbi:hypothetical protein LOD99_5099 [Oopsacas minuta]|uniref:Uncharacterized protein n=1 Tax=Oopsacas minuta TaxID=111878 RepID=A0AAV7JSV9_9METZ|nr:hypothetical protein LOD99_5099 [Oopsacas minuta]
MDYVLVDPALFNIHDDELAQNAEAVWLLNNLNESSERLESQFTNSRMRTRRQSNRTEPYSIPDRFQSNLSSIYPLPHLSQTNHPHLTVPLQTVLPSVSAAVVYPTSVSLPQQLVTGIAPPVQSFLLTSLENATSHIIGAHSTVAALGAHPQSLNPQVDRPLAVLQGGIATALTDPSQVPTVISAPSLIPPLSLHSDPLLNRNIWDQGFMPIHISATQHQPTN